MMEKEKVSGIDFFEKYLTVWVLIDLYGQSPIEKEHIDNNTAVRDMLLQRGIKPEQLSPNEDIKKVQRRINKDNEKTLKNK